VVCMSAEFNLGRWLRGYGADEVLAGDDLLVGRLLAFCQSLEVVLVERRY
jgi:hypothetical protein